MSADPFYATQDEHALIGACLMGDRTQETCWDVLAMIRPEMLTDDTARDALAVISKLTEENKAPNVVSLAREWPKVHGNPAPMAWLSESQDKCASEAQAAYHAHGVIEAHKRRQIRDTGTRMALAVADPTKTVENILAEAEAGLDSGHQSSPAPKSAKEVGREFIDLQQAAFERNGALSGLPTGFPLLDHMTHGLQPGELIIIGARPSVGKTAMGCHFIVEAAVRNNIPALFISAEMSNAAIMRRLVATVGSVPMGELRNGPRTEGDFKTLTNNVARLRKAPIQFLDVIDSPSIAVVSAGIRRAARRDGVKLVVVDYLQKLNSTERHEKRTYEVAEISGRLKAAARACNIPVIALAQLNRESEKDKRRLPGLHDLGDSKAIEQDGDTIMLLHRDRDGENKADAKLIVAKQRDGECGVVDLHYEGIYCRFTQPSKFEQ